MWTSVCRASTTSEKHREARNTHPISITSTSILAQPNVFFSFFSSEMLVWLWRWCWEHCTQRPYFICTSDYIQSTGEACCQSWIYYNTANFTATLTFIIWRPICPHFYWHCSCLLDCRCECRAYVADQSINMWIPYEFTEGSLGLRNWYTCWYSLHTYQARIVEVKN
jgi:hypothetical protein